MGVHSLIKTTWQTFRQGRSGLSNLLELFEDITAARDKGKSVDVVYLNSGGGFCLQNECPCCGLQEKCRAVAGRAPHAGPDPPGSSAGIAMIPLLLCAKS